MVIGVQDLLGIPLLLKISCSYIFWTAWGRCLVSEQIKRRIIIVAMLIEKKDRQKQ